MKEFSCGLGSLAFLFFRRSGRWDSGVDVDVLLESRNARCSCFLFFTQRMNSLIYHDAILVYVISMCICKGNCTKWMRTQ